MHEGLPHHEHRPSLTPKQGSDQLQTALQLLEAGIDHLLDSESFATYLRTVSRFHSYSFGNIALILAQRSDATQVAGYRTWQTLERQVRRGERAIKILVPHRVRVVDTTGEDSEPSYRLVGWGVGSVFDISQTDGKSLPQPPVVEVLASTSDAGAQVYRALETYMTAQGIQVVRKSTAPANGWYSPHEREIAVSDTLQTDAAAKTLAHEAAHFVAEHRGLEPREHVETIAESTAFVVMHHFGIDTGSYSFGYVATWAKDRKVLQHNLDTIQKTAHQLIQGLESILTAPGPDQVTAMVGEQSGSRMPQAPASEATSLTHASW